MKKTILYITTMALFITAGCTSKEQEEKINAFWNEQLSSFFSQYLNMRPAQKPGPTPEQLLLDKEGNPVFPQEESPTQPQDAQELTTVATTESVEQPEVAAKSNETPSNHAIVQAFLFIHADSPQVKQLKADNWDKIFQQKYQGRVALTEYDMKNPASKVPLQKMMRKHKLSTITVPVLFIGNQIFQGYPFNQEDQAIEKALTMATTAQTRPRSVQKRKQQSDQFMEIIMEDTQKKPKTNTRASARDNRAMQLALASVEKNNQAMLADVGSMFGEDTKAQAYVIISRTERLLRNKASSSPDYKTYLSTQKTLLQWQEKELNQLMRQNAKNLRSVRG